MNMVTIYMENADYIKRKSATSLPLQNTMAHTPKAGASQTSNNIISKNDIESQEKFSKGVPVSAEIVRMAI